MAIALSLALALPTPSFAAPPNGAVYLDSSQMFQTSSNGRTYICGNLPPWAPGRVVQGYFYGTKKEIKNIDVKLKASRLSSAKRAKLQQTRQTRKAYLSAAKGLCANGSGGGNGGGESNFDSHAMVTATGKAAFQIPSNMQASVNAGLAKWNNTCRGCHVGSAYSLPLKNYPAIRTRIQLSPMLFQIPNEITDQDIADITAAVNY